MIQSMAEYRAMLSVYRQRAQEAEKLQKMLLGAGATVENVQQEMAPLFQAVIALKAELAEYEQNNSQAARVKAVVTERQRQRKRKPRQLRRGR
jgi:hypothetical protein